MSHRTPLFFLFGLWMSFIGFFMAGMALLPQVSHSGGTTLSASVYQSTHHEKSREASTIAQAGKVVLVDQGSEKITLYENNQEQASFPVASFAPRGSLWQASAGKYIVEKKEYKHFSPLLHAWFPYSVQVSGNVFIHGDPDQGLEVDSGAIHLRTKDAKEVFDFVSQGTQVVVTGAVSRDMFATSSQYYLTLEGKLPQVNATSFVVADVDTGEVLWEHAADLELNPDALVSLQTALTAVEHIDQYKTVRIGELVLDPSIVHRHVPSRDDEVKLGNLIYPLLFATNDTAGKTYEKVLGTTAFVTLMNKQAGEIGMEHSHYSSGLSGAPATTTARDLFELLSYIDREQHFLVDVSLRKESSVFATSGKERLHWENKNPWIISGDGRYRGGLSQINTGGAGNAVVLFSLPVSEFSERTVAFIVLDSTDIMGDITTLTQFIEQHYSYGIKEVEVIGKDKLFIENILSKILPNNFENILDANVTYDRRT